MFKRLFHAQHPAMLGIDISPTAVAILKLSPHGDHYCVDAYAQSMLPEQHTSDYSQDEVVVNCIRSLLTTVAFDCKQAIIAVPYSSVISKVIQVSACLTEQDMEAFVMMEARQSISEPVDALHIDYMVLPSPVEHPGMLDVLIVVSRSEYVNHRVALLQRAGLTVSMVDVECYAVARVVQLLLSKSCAEYANKTIAILDMNDVCLRLFVVHETSLIFSYEDLFEKLPAHDAILMHAKRAFQFFYASHGSKTVSQLLLTGNRASQSDVAIRLQQSLATPTQVLHLSEHFVFAKSVDRDVFIRDSSVFMIACGLALYSLTPSMTSINLLPWRAVKRARIVKQFICYVLLACLVALGIVFSGDHYVRRHIRSQLQYNQALELNIAHIKPGRSMAFFA